MQIEIEVTGQKIKRLNSPGSVADTLNYLTCHFIFVGEEWDNTVRTAYFNNQKSGERYAQIIADDGTCTVPWEALTDKGFVRFSVAGEREDYRITTDVESFYNSDTIYGGNPSEPPTPDQYDQMIALAEQTKEIAESVRRDADEGKFDGEPGKQGNPGRDGVSPNVKVEQTDDGAVITITDAAGTTTAELKNGKEGKPGQNATEEQVRGAVDAYMAEHPVQVDTDDLIKIAIKEEASGAVPIVITDSAEIGVQDLTMQGWTEQAQYEGKNLFDGIFTVDTVLDTNGETVPCSGRSTTDFIKVKQSTDYTGFTRYLRAGYYDVGKVFISYDDADTVTRQTPEGCEYVRFNFINGSDVMFNEGSAALPYEPYTGGQPSPNPDYPQEIVSAGKYDEGTGKYQYEINVSDAEESPTKSQTVTLTSDRPLTKWDKLEKRNGQLGWLYKSAEIVLDGSEDEAWSKYIDSENTYGFKINIPSMLIGSIEGKGYVDCFTVVGMGISTLDKNCAMLGTRGDSTLYLKIEKKELTDSSTQSFKTWLQSNPLTLWYETAEETFVPLSESEQSALNALTTYYPTTVLDNDQGCEMSVQYIADTKAYIDKKISAIQAAIVNTI